MGFNWFDVVIVCGMLWWLFAGLASGFIREVIGLGGLFLGIILAGQYHLPLAGIFRPALEADIASIAAFAIIAFGVTLVAHWIGSLLHKAVSLLFLGWADHLLGGIFGVVKGVMIFAVAIAILTKFPLPLMGAEIGVRESLLSPYFLAYLPIISALMPGMFDALRSLLR